jgi:hypothetical protein
MLFQVEEVEPGVELELLTLAMEVEEHLQAVEVLHML